MLDKTRWDPEAWTVSEWPREQWRGSQLSVMGVDNHLRVTDEDLAPPLERPWIRYVNETSTKGVDLPPPSGNVEQL